MPVNSASLVLFDLQTNRWSELIKAGVSFGFPNWSEHGRYIYVWQFSDRPAVLRLRLSDRKVERVADLKDLPTTGHYGIWLGLAPDDSPILLRDTGSQDIYAADWESP
jgi:hypothetical protein